METKSPQMVLKNYESKCKNHTLHFLKKLKLDEMLKYNTHNYRTLRKAVLRLCVAALGGGVEQPFHRSRILGILHIR